MKREMSDNQLPVSRWLLAMTLVAIGWNPTIGRAQTERQTAEPQRRMTSHVSPALEIEILDPNLDPKGNPAIRIDSSTPGQTLIDIAPSILVHRFYYTGNRSFRGPDMPGGPSIVVVAHPRTGQRCYIEVQMLPGAPTVHYRQHQIEYDFGNRAVLLDFPRFGGPKVSVRNGRPLAEKVSQVLGVEAAKSAASKTGQFAKAVAQKTHTVLQGAHLAIGEMSRPITLPMQNLARLMPGAAMLSDPALESKVIEATAIRQAKREAFQVRTLTNPNVDIVRQ